MNVINLLLCIIILFFNCATQEKVVVQEKAVEKETKSVIEDGFEPLSVLKDDVDIPPPEFKIEEIDYKDLLPVELKMLDSVNISIDDMAPGFRVQIGIFVNVESAIEMEDKVRSLFEEDVYLDFNPPWHKVSVGDCLTRRDAMTLLQKVKMKGFEDAFITPAKVYKYPDLRSKKKEETEILNVDSLNTRENR